jgi:hypothetical protein
MARREVPILDASANSDGLTGTVSLPRRGEAAGRAARLAIAVRASASSVTKLVSVHEPALGLIKGSVIKSSHP